jgi:acyl-coenzyme A synthetase/AMP-(fatty) acid ligase
VAVSTATIEAALATHPAVSEVACVTSATSPPAVGLFFTWREGSHDVRVAALREHLLGLLPFDQMPDLLRSVDRIPLTDRGKVDRAALAVQLTH